MYVGITCLQAEEVVHVTLSVIAMSRVQHNLQPIFNLLLLAFGKACEASSEDPAVSF